MNGEHRDDEGFRRERYGRYIPDGDSVASPLYATIPLDEPDRLHAIEQQFKETPTSETEMAIRNVRSTLDAARAKHPDFCGELVDGCHDYYRARMLEAQRRNDTAGWTPSAEAILFEEVWELLEALAAGRWADAYLEAAQVAAVAIRIMLEVAFKERCRLLKEGK